MNGCYLSLFPQSSKARRYQPTRGRLPGGSAVRRERDTLLALIVYILASNGTVACSRTLFVGPLIQRGLGDNFRSLILRVFVGRKTNRRVHHRPAEAQQNRRERHRKGFATKRTAPFGTFSFRLMHFHFLHQFYPFTSRITLFNSWFPTVLFARNEHRN